MKNIDKLIERNRAWAGRITNEDPQFFSGLARQQTPEYLWIGCSDSRVPATQLVDMAPGEMFVHRNVANVVGHTDLNCLSVMQFAVEALDVRHIIVCGHYGCGGVRAALTNAKLGLIDNWLRAVRSVADAHRPLLDRLDGAARERALCELNVVEQVVNVCESTVVQAAWERGRSLSVHGLIYGLDDGLLREVGPHVLRAKDLREEYERAVAAVAERAR